MVGFVRGDRGVDPVRHAEAHPHAELAAELEHLRAFERALHGAVAVDRLVVGGAAQDVEHDRRRGRRHAGGADPISRSPRRSPSSAVVMTSPPCLVPTGPRRAGGRSRHRTRTRRRSAAGGGSVVDVSRSMSSRSAAAWSSKAKKSRSAPVISRSCSSETPATPHLVCCMTTTVSTPSTWLDSARLRSTSSVTRPPALRMTWASPRCRPSAANTSMRASMQVTHGEPPQRAASCRCSSGPRRSPRWPAGSARSRSIGGRHLSRDHRELSNGRGFEGRPSPDLTCDRRRDPGVRDAGDRDERRGPRAAGPDEGLHRQRR